MKSQKDGKRKRNKIRDYFQCNYLSKPYDYPVLIRHVHWKNERIWTHYLYYMIYIKIETLSTFVHAQTLSLPLYHPLFSVSFFFFFFCFPSFIPYLLFLLLYFTVSLSIFLFPSLHLSFFSSLFLFLSSSSASPTLPSLFLPLLISVTVFPSLCMISVFPLVNYTSVPICADPYCQRLDKNYHMLCRWREQHR